MAVVTEPGAPPNPEETGQAASGRPVGMGAVTYGTAALALLDCGYQPLPIRPRAKRPSLKRWTEIRIGEREVEAWTRRFPGWGIGLRTGALVGVDVDILDPDLAHQVGHLVQSRFGETLMRVGRWPKRLFLYRAAIPFAKLSIPGHVEVLGRGQQFVAFGMHPGTGRPYHWPLEETPLDVPLADLPEVDAVMCSDLLGAIRGLLPPPAMRGGRRQRTSSSQPSGGSVERSSDGLVVDGRDGWLSSIAYHAVHDAVDLGQQLDRDALAEIVWQRFASTTDLDRARKDGTAGYAPADAAAKVADKLRLLADGRLPPREAGTAEAAYVGPTASAAEARHRLDEALRRACDAIAAWHETGGAGRCPQVGIRATVGIGKSVSARRHLLALGVRLAASGAPARVAVFTPSHALAEETAAAWRAEGMESAVLRGYEARDPISRQPMCRDLAAVRQAVASRLDVQSTACATTGGRRCVHFDSCLKQQNRREVEAADVVVAAYDALFTGFATSAGSIGVLLVDEGCWARAVTESRGLWVETFAEDLMDGLMGRARERDALDMADLLELRRRAAEALAANGPGPLARARLGKAGLTADECLGAALLEARRLRDPGLFPGMPPAERAASAAQVERNERTHRYVTAWRAMAELLAGAHGHNGRLEIRPPGPLGLHEIVVTGVKKVHRSFHGVPVLHLDATLRPDLAWAILPDLEVTEVEAAAPHMSVRLVSGSFGKGTLCQDAHAGPEENQRRANRLRECVDYVRWQALRAAPGRTLVVTYKDCESAFDGIRGIEVVHFNAVAGLDRFRDVALLVIVGRPLPSEHALHPLSAAFFGHVPRGSYRFTSRGVRMRDAASRTVRVIEHEDEQANLLRAAICDDELIQAIGRGRGVNRTPATPLEVHVLADVALPLVHDQVLAWETVVPDVVQRMLLAGIAVDSPADAAVLHREIFSSEKQAQKAFERGGFKRQNPIINTYRGMSLKSARYRRSGRGRSWQRAWWIGEAADAARAQLEAALGPLAGWEA